MKRKAARRVEKAKIAAEQERQRLEAEEKERKEEEERMIKLREQRVAEGKRGERPFYKFTILYDSISTTTMCSCLLQPHHLIVQNFSFPLSRLGQDTQVFNKLLRSDIQHHNQTQ